MKKLLHAGEREAKLLVLIYPTERTEMDNKMTLILTVCSVYSPLEKNNGNTTDKPHKLVHYALHPHMHSNEVESISPQHAYEVHYEPVALFEGQLLPVKYRQFRRHNQHEETDLIKEYDICKVIPKVSSLCILEKNIIGKLERKWILTESVQKVLHVQVEGVNNGSSCLILISPNVFSGQTPSHCPSLKHFDLHCRSKTLVLRKTLLPCLQYHRQYCWRTNAHLAYQIPPNTTYTWYIHF